MRASGSARITGPLSWKTKGNERGFAMTLSYRTAVRLFCAVCALLLAMLGVVVAHAAQTARYRRRLEYGYLRAVQEAASSLNTMTADLQKSAYSGSAPRIAELSARVQNEAGIAKASLSSLPAGGERLDGTYRFLSQVGDYSMYLAKKSGNGQELTDEERQNAELFVRYARELGGRLRELEWKLSTGEVSLADFEAAQAEPAGDLKPAPGRAVRLSSLERNMDGYPKLIYDGPFSDHILDRSPQATRGRPVTAEASARALASRFTGVAPALLKPAGEERSNMPSYLFESEGFTVGVTKFGEYVTFMLGSRLPGEQTLTVGQARRAASDFLDGNEIYSMRESYYELSAGVLTVNFAYEQNGVACYPDLIKVGVAMDNGQVLFYDARGFLMNHRDRLLPAQKISAEEAGQRVSKSLNVESSRLAVIPTAGGNEIFCHEFRCKNAAGETVLVYINAETGAEEEILLVISSENGVLTV